jgi:hypothetical protein
MDIFQSHSRAAEVVQATHAVCACRGADWRSRTIPDRLETEKNA